jgi:hypothetical protein
MPHALSRVRIHKLLILDSSVDIETGKRMNDWGFHFHQDKVYSLVHKVQTGSEVHPMVSLSPGVKQLGSGADQSP